MPPDVVVRVPGPLRFLLPPRDRVAGERRLRFDPDATLGHLVRAAGVPPTEVGSLRLDGAAAPPSARAGPGSVVLLMRRSLPAGALVRGDGAEAQLADVLDRFRPALAPLTRCTACGGRLAPVAKAEVADRLEPGTRRSFDEFSRCVACGQVYWRGAHARRIEQVITRASGARSGGYAGRHN